MGACFDCVVTIDGQAGLRACMTPARDGMRIGPGQPVAAIAPLPEQILTPDVLIVGGGPAGLSAAIAAHATGASTLILEERASLGGQYFKPAAVPDSQSRMGQLLKVQAAAIPTIHAMVWGAFPGPEIAAVSSVARLLIRPKALVLCPGAHEAPVHVAGWTLPGCMTTGALQGLVRSHRVIPGQPVIIAGNGPLNFQVAAELIRAGGRVAAVIEAAPRPSLGALMAMAATSPRLAWDGASILAQLHRAGVPVLWNTRPIEILGTNAVEALRTSNGQTIAAGIVALNHGFQGETGLARLLGVTHIVANGRLETQTEPDGATNIANVFVAGDGARMGGAVIAQHRGHAAGLAAAGRLAPLVALHRAERFQSALWRAFAAQPPNARDLLGTTVICRCEEVTATTIRDAGDTSSSSLKRATRAGMGPCSGRFCALAIGQMRGASTEKDFAAPRVPIRPILAGHLLADHPEPRDAVLTHPLATQWTTSVTPSRQPESAEIVIIGGGIIGLATALYLARDGADVLVLDRGEPGMQASTANAGSLHIQLVPYVYAAGGGGPMADALPLGPASVALWRDLARDANEDLGLREEGGLILAETDAELDLLRAKSAFERSRGIYAEVIGPLDLRRLAPNLDGAFAGAAFCPSEGQGDPLRGTMALLSLAQRAGARVAAGQEVTALTRDGAFWRVCTQDGEIRARHVINAAGAQAARIGGLAGVSIPMHALIQQVIATEAAPPMLRQLVAWTGRHLSLKQGNAGHILVGGGWPGDQDATGAARVRRESVEGNLALACRALPPLRGVHVLRAWTGLAPHLDRAPLISATPGYPGLWHGVTGNGYTLGPVVGRMLAEAVRGRGTLPESFAL